MIYEPRSLCCASVCLYDMGFIMIARGLWWAKRVRAANFASRSHGNNTMCSAANLRVWTMKVYVYGTLKELLLARSARAPLTVN